MDRSTRQTLTIVGLVVVFRALELAALVLSTGGSWGAWGNAIAKQSLFAAIIGLTAASLFVVVPSRALSYAILIGTITALGSVYSLVAGRLLTGVSYVFHFSDLGFPLSMWAIIGLGVALVVWTLSPHRARTATV